MNKRTLLLFLTIFILLLVIGVIGFYFFFPKSGKFGQKAQVLPAPLNPPAVEVKETFSWPIDRKFLAKDIPMVTDSTRPVFFLQPKAPIYAIFSGKVIYVGNKKTGDIGQFENVTIKNETQNILASYLFSFGSKIFVKQDEFILAGQKIAEISEVGLGLDCFGGANLGITLMQGDQPAKLTKEMFK